MCLGSNGPVSRATGEGEARSLCWAKEEDVPELINQPVGNIHKQDADKPHGRDVDRERDKDHKPARHSFYMPTACRRGKVTRSALGLQPPTPTAVKPAQIVVWLIRCKTFGHRW